MSNEGSSMSARKSHLKECTEDYGNHWKCSSTDFRGPRSQILQQLALIIGDRYALQGQRMFLVLLCSLKNEAADQIRLKMRRRFLLLLPKLTIEMTDGLLKTQRMFP
ncbi:hypothetical protein J437_LFUL019580 [Ladona fulva]|uniref:Uncharacterized protein n=1 Tax=Ladona fulva TaxID=123851 RepID=A0A8K0KXZ7_LADFU|nr:hypothetical protein J437_LFUL019580 [Ladona fulva]